MAKTTATGFRELLNGLELTPHQKALVDQRRAVTHKYLAEKFPRASDMPLTRTSLIGSASRDTLIRPFNDIDVLAVFSNSGKAFGRYRGDSRKFLYRVRDALAGFNVRVVGARGQAVRLLYTHDPHVDIAPVFPHSGGGYLLPAGDGSWIRTDPDLQYRWLVGRETQLGATLLPLIRVMKQWNRMHSQRLESFHLEVMATTSFGALGTNIPSAAERCFAWAPKHMDVKDPAGYSGNLASYLTKGARADAVTSFATAAERAAKALDAERRGNHGEAMRLWRIIFGDLFPAYG